MICPAGGAVSHLKSSWSVALQQLYHLPIKSCTAFRIPLLTFKIIHNLAPSHLTELIHIHTPSCSLRSSSTIQLFPTCQPNHHEVTSLQLICPASGTLSHHTFTLLTCLHL